MMRTGIVALLVGLPGVLDDYTLIEVTIYAVMSILGVSLATLCNFANVFADTPLNPELARYGVKSGQ